jgi:regulatory protein
MTPSEEKALKRALNILAYAPNTKAGLRRKLKEKGVSAADIEAVMTYLDEKGYIDEVDYLYRFVESYCSGKKYGPKRIRMAAREKGFDPEIMDIHFDAACERVDFVAACRARIRAYKGDDPDKLIAALLRYGFDYSTIKESLRGDTVDPF